MKKNKKAFLPSWAWVIAGLVVLVGGAAYFKIGGMTLTSGVSGNDNTIPPPPSANLNPPAPPASSASSGCPDTKNTVVYSRVLDLGSSSISYVANGQGIQYKNIRTGVIEGNQSGSAGGYQSTGTTLICGETYQIYSLSTNDGIGSDNTAAGYAETVALSGNNQYFDFESRTVDNLVIKVEDLNNNTLYLPLNKHDQAVDSANSTGFTTLNNTRVYHTSGLADEYPVGTDQDADFKFYIKTATTNKVAGDAQQPLWITVDVGSLKEYEDPVVSFNSKRLEGNELGSLTPDDKSAPTLADADFAWKIGNGDAIRDTQLSGTLYVKAKSGKNPTDNVVMCFWPEGVYRSGKATNTWKHGVFNDASTQVLVMYDSTMTPCVKFMIA